MAVITVEKAEEIILYYICLRYQVIHGEMSKVSFNLHAKASALGISLRSAWNIIRYGRRIGMIQGAKYLKPY